MIVTMGMVLDGLARRYPCAKGPCYDALYQIRRTIPVLQEAPHDAEPSCLCLPTHAWSGAIRPSGVIVASESTRDPVSNCAIAVKGPATSSELRNAVSEVVEEYELWASDLLDLNTRGESLEVLVDFAHTLFENPIEILDQDFRVYAQTAEDGMGDSLWVSLERKGEQESSRVMNDREKDNFVTYLSGMSKSNVLRDFRASTGIKVHACRVRAFEDRIIAVNVLEKNRGITDGDLHCLIHFADIVGSKMRAIESSWHDKSRVYLSLLQDVVKGELARVDDLKAQLGKSWIRLKPRFTVLAITCREGMLKHHQLCDIEDELHAMIPESCGVIHERALILFVNHEESDSAVRNPEGLRAYARKRNLVVGVSETVGDGGSLRELIDQARLALRVREKRYPDSFIVHHRDCRAYAMLDACSRRADWRRYLSPCLETLARHDDAATAPLLPTLQCLADCHWSRQAAAKALGVQRNTLQYRIGKIEALCSVDLSDPATIDDICFSLELMRYCSA